MKYFLLPLLLILAGCAITEVKYTSPDGSIVTVSNVRFFNNQSIEGLGAIKEADGSVAFEMGKATNDNTIDPNTIAAGLEMLGRLGAAAAVP